MLYRECFQHLYNVERKRIVTAPNVDLRLNRGERPWPLPNDVQSELLTAFSACIHLVQQYPSYQSFYARLSQHIGFPKEQIVAGAGIEEFIRTLMFLCCSPDDHYRTKAAVLWPTCAMYDIYAKAFGVELVQIRPAPGEHFQSRELLAQIADRSIADFLGVLFIPNPGQPVETYFLPYQLKYVADWCAERDIVLAIDEAHYGFGAQSALDLVNYCDNVLILRTFSKFFGAASIRVGYAVGQEKVIKPLDAVRPSGEIAGPSLLAATVLLDNFEKLNEDAMQVAHARNWLVHELRQLGLRAWGSKGFSVLIEFPTVTRAVKIAARLAERGVYVKAGFPTPVERCMLVACGPLPMMQRFYAELVEVTNAG